MASSDNTGRNFRAKYNDVRELIIACYAQTYQRTFGAVRATTAKAGSLMTLLAVKETVEMNHEVVLNTFYKDMARWLVTEKDGLAFMRCFLCNALNRLNPLFVSIVKNNAVLDDAPRIEYEEVARSLDEVFTSPVSRILMPHMSKLIDPTKVLASDFSWISVYPADEPNFQLLHHWFLAEFFFDWLPNLALNLSSVDGLRTIDALRENFKYAISGGNVFALQVAQSLVDKSLLYDEKIFSTLDAKFKAVTMPRPTELLGVESAKHFEKHGPFEKLIHLVVRSLPEVLAFQINLGVCWFFIYHFEQAVTDDVIISWKKYLVQIGFTKYQMTSNNHLVQFAALAEPDSVAGVLQKVNW